MTNIYRHGEALLVPTELPKDAVLKEETTNFVVAHSETGHNHVLISEKTKFKIYSHGLDTYLELNVPAELTHQKTGKHVHKTHVITPAVYKITIKKEFDYFTNALRAVRD